MERLTERWCKGMVRIKGCSSLYPDKERKGAPATSAIVRLAAYEDTGMTPEEIDLMKGSWRAVCKEYGINRIPGNGERDDETTHQ